MQEIIDAITGLLGPFILGGGIVSAIFFILLLVGLWLMFKKMGEKGWKGIIPIYNVYVWFGRVWEKKWFWIWLAVLIVGSILANFLGFLGTIVNIANLVMFVILCYKTSKGFGHGIPYTVFLVLCCSIAVFVLGINKDKFRRA
ncbi:MAG: hypothetical protein J6Y65_03140 [Eggerthellaceae bacterium]|nr:hypothetical protein [Eggerthellaceae bacterium]